MLTPSQELDEIIVGILARAQRRHPVRVCGLTFLSSHFHLILEVDDAAQVDRFRYVLENGVKEGLVGSPLDWPGVQCAKALVSGEALHGWWYDRTKEGCARRRGEDFTKHQYATAETLEFTALPCWRHLAPEEYRRRIAGMVAAIEAEAERNRRLRGREVLGVAGVLAESPLNAPAKQKRSPAPAFHAASRAARQELRDAYAEFMKEYREASARLRAGDRTAIFPAGSFPPALPFVR
ncbi:MAG: hypothetical protein HC897_00505 [Thermoanaerobaculia bacterium]|nr:hypothetical protein [Thermoanaerobaculia bacterium]